jgi:hypothetical protein
MTGFLLAFGALALALLAVLALVIRRAGLVRRGRP